MPDRITQVETDTILQGKEGMIPRAELWAQIVKSIATDYSQVLKPNGVYY